MRSRGLTLIEIMVAMVVSTIVALGIFAFSSIQQATNTLHSRNVRVQQALDGAMHSIGYDIRVAGMPFAKLCSELRIWGASAGQLINPGAYINPAAGNAFLDPDTGEAYWVMRDGIQAHWNSGFGNSMDSCDSFGGTSLNCPADMLDVIVPERNYTNMFGVFMVADPAPTNPNSLLVSTDTAAGALLQAPDIAQVQQLMPPGTFILLVNNGGNQFDPNTTKQCPIMQVTGDVQFDPAAGAWSIPTQAALSSFNANKVDLLEPTSSTNVNMRMPGGNTDVADVVAGSEWQVVPLGRLRWSRYAVDYTARRIPYLVRYDLIGFQQQFDPNSLGNVDYPFCAQNTCRAPGLHLPQSNDPPVAVAIGPMIEDMQVAVGCDGWAGPLPQQPDNPTGPRPAPDNNHVDRGPNAGPLINLADALVNEFNDPIARDLQNDEWLGNAQNEETAPDCVWWGTAECNGNFAAAPCAGPAQNDWEQLEGDSNPPPNYRMSPQIVRVTLVGSSEEMASRGGTANDRVLAVEDRPEVQATTGPHERFSLTRRFSPRNLRWRSPTQL